MNDREFGMTLLLNKYLINDISKMIVNYAYRNPPGVFNVMDVKHNLTLGDEMFVNVNVPCTLYLPDCLEYTGCQYIIIKSIDQKVDIVSQPNNKIITGSTEINSLSFLGPSQKRVVFISNGKNWLIM